MQLILPAITNLMFTSYYNTTQLPPAITPTSYYRITSCILFGFGGNRNNTIIIDICIVHAKYFMYEKQIKNDNNIEFLAYLSLPKKQLLIAKEKCIVQNQGKKN